MASGGLTQEQFREYLRERDRRASGGGSGGGRLTYQDVPTPVVPVTPVDNSPSFATEFLKGGLSGGTGEVSDLIARRVIGTEALQPATEGFSLPYHAGYALGTIAGLPARLGTWAVAKTAGHLLPKAAPIVQLAAASGLANAGLAGVSAAGQGEDVVDAIARGGLIGGAAGALAPKIAPWVNKKFGARIIPSAEEEIAAATKKVAGTTPTKQPIGAVPKPGTPSGISTTPGKRTWQTAAEEAYYRLHPDEVPPPAYTIFTDDQMAAVNKVLEEEKILSDLFPKPGKATAPISGGEEARQPFTAYVGNTIRQELDSSVFADTRFDYSDLKKYAEGYISALEQGISRKSKDFPKHTNPFQKAISDMIDTRYKQAVSDWKEMTLTAGSQTAKGAAVRVDPDAVTPEIPTPVVDIAPEVPPSPARPIRPTDVVEEPPTARWSVSPEGEVSGPGLVSMQLPSVYRRGSVRPMRPTNVLQQIGNLTPELGVPVVPTGRTAYSESVDYPVQLGSERGIPVPPGVRPPRLTRQFSAPEYPQGEALDIMQLPEWARRIEPEKTPPVSTSITPEVPIVKTKQAKVKPSVTSPVPKGGKLLPGQIGDVTTAIEQRLATIQRTLGNNPITKKTIMDRLAREQQEKTQENLLRDEIEDTLRILDNPIIVNSLPQSVLGKIQKVKEKWETASSDFLRQKGSTKLSLAQDDVASVIQRLKTEGKSNEDIAREIADGLRKRVDPQGMISKGIEVDERGGDLSGLMLAGRASVPMGGKTDAEWINAASAEIHKLVGPEAGDDLISRAYQAGSPKVAKPSRSPRLSTKSLPALAVAGAGVAALPGLSEAAGKPRSEDMKLAADIARLRKRTADNPDAIYLGLRDLHSNIPGNELRERIGRTIGRKPRAYGPQVAVDPNTQRKLSRLFSEDEVF